MRRQEEERSPPARWIGTSGEVLLRVERDEAPTGLFCTESIICMLQSVLHGQST